MMNQNRVERIRKRRRSGRENKKKIRVLIVNALIPYCMMESNNIIHKNRALDLYRGDRTN